MKLTSRPDPGRLFFQKSAGTGNDSPDVPKVEIYLLKGSSLGVPENFTPTRFAHTKQLFNYVSFAFSTFIVITLRGSHQQAWV